MHIFGLITFAGIVLSSPIGQPSITQTTVVGFLSSELNSSTEVMLTTILESSTVKDENNYQDCICAPFYKCKTYKAVPNGHEIIDIRMTTASCQSYFDVCCNDTTITSTEKYIPSIPDTSDSDRGCDDPEEYSDDTDVTDNEDDIEQPSDGHQGDHTQHINVTDNEEDTGEPNVTDNEDVTEDSTEYMDYLYVTEKSSNGHEGDHNQNIYVTNNEEDTEDPYYVTDNEDDTEESSNHHKGFIIPPIYVITHNEDDTEKPSDGHKQNHTQQIYVTSNEEDTDKTSDYHKADLIKDSHITHNEANTKKLFNGHKQNLTQQVYVTNNEEDNDKTTDVHEGDLTKDPYITHNEDDTEKPSDGHKQNHTQQIYVTSNKEDTDKTFDDHKADLTKDPYITHNEDDTEKPSDGHKQNHTQQIYVTSNKEDTDKTFDDHKADLTKDPYITHNEDDTEKPSDGHKQNHTQQIYVTSNKEDTDKTFDDHKADLTKDPYITHNEDDTEKQSVSHKGDHSKDPYVTGNDDDTDKTSNGHEGDHNQNINVTNNEEDTEDPYYVTDKEDDAEKSSNHHKGFIMPPINVTNNEDDTEKPSDGHKQNHTQQIYVTSNKEDTDKTSDDHKRDHNKDKCGVWNKYGVGFRIGNAIDSETQFGEFPSMVAIFKEEGCKKLVFRCSGSLIKKDVILTVAHCVVWLDISTLVVRAGEWDLETDKEILNHQDRRVTKVVHPNNYKGGFYNDVALVFTKYSFSLQDNIQLICLPSKDDIIIKDTCYSSGWPSTPSYNNYTIVKKTESGKTKETGQYKVSILKKYGLTMVHQDKCSTDLIGPKDLLQDSYICVDGIEDMCRNDGGSPYMCPYKDDPDRLVQVGIVVQCGKENEPGPFINVISFMHWINNEIDNRG